MCTFLLTDGQTNGQTDKRTKSIFFAGFQTRPGLRPEQYLSVISRSFFFVFIERQFWQKNIYPIKNEHIQVTSTLLNLLSIIRNKYIYARIWHMHVWFRAGGPLAWSTLFVVMISLVGIGSQNLPPSKKSCEWRVAGGEWRVGGGWRVAGGEWRVAGGEWRVAGGEWRVSKKMDLSLPCPSKLMSKIFLENLQNFYKIPCLFKQCIFFLIKQNFCLNCFSRHNCCVN